MQSKLSLMRLLLLGGLVFGLTVLFATVNNQVTSFISVALTEIFYLLLLMSGWWFIWQRKISVRRAVANNNEIKDLQAVERYVQQNWSQIALTAWQGYNRHGRGCISIWANRNYELSFTHRERLKYALAELDLPLSQRTALLKLADDYKPESEIAVIFWTGKGKILYLPVAKAGSSPATC